MTPEGKVKAYLFKRVAQVGGEARNVKWIGRKNCPDVFVMFPLGLSFWVETKAPGDKPRTSQLKEHRRMDYFQQSVVVLDTKEKVDKWINEIT